MYMKADEEAVMDVFKSFGFTQTLFKDMTGTVSDNLTRLNEQLAQAGEKEKAGGGPLPPQLPEGRAAILL